MVILYQPLVDLSSGFYKNIDNGIFFCYCYFRRCNILNNRLKELRKNHLHLTQAEFGKKIGLTDVAISRYEKGERNITQQVFVSICREFNVNEEWLRTGKGEMFNKENLFSLDEFLKRQEATNLEIEIVKLLFSFDKKTRGELISKLKNIFQSEAIINELSATEEISLTKEESEDFPPEYENMSVEEIEKQADFWDSLYEKRQAELKSQKQKENSKNMTNTA